MGQIDQSEKLMGDVQESELPITPPAHKKRSLSQKLGIFNLLVLILGTLVIFAALAILIFVWFVSLRYALKNEQTPNLWNLIVKHSWTSRVVTLSSTVIRLVTATQLGIFTAIMAALVLEKAGAPRADLPKVSIMRCSNSGPNSFLLSIPSSIFRVSVLPYAILIVIAIIDAFALQFTSTFLLSDFSVTQVVLRTTKQSTNFGLHEVSVSNVDPVIPWAGVNYWLAAPTTYNRFAELRETGSNTAKYMDTGTSYRAFLPFRNTDDQNMVRSYSGPMTIVDTRVVCVQPTVSNISFDAWDNEDGAFPTFSAMYDWSNTNSDITGDGRFPQNVNCSIPTIDQLYDNYWATSLCSISWVSLARLASAIPDPPSKTMPNGHTSVHVLVNATGWEGDWTRLKEANETLEQVTSSTTPWAQLKSDNVTVSVSVCFFNPNPDNYKAAAQSIKDGNYSTIDWISKSATYNTSSVRTMFGVMDTSLTQEERGLLELTAPDNWTGDGEDNLTKINTTVAVWDALGRTDNLHQNPNGGTSVQTTSTFNDRAQYGQAIHRTHTAIVQATLQQTRNPALALQTLWTILMDMAYYDFLPQFDISAPAMYDISEARNIPTQWKAFAAVVGLICIHLMLVFLAVLMFLGTEISLLGNSWQVIAQVVSTDTADLVHHSATSTDDEAMKYAKTSGFDNEIIRIAKCETSGRAQATAIRRHVD